MEAILRVCLEERSTYWLSRSYTIEIKSNMSLPLLAFRNKIYLFNLYEFQNYFTGIRHSHFHLLFLKIFNSYQSNF